MTSSVIKIIIVDDEEIIRNNLSAFLLDEGFEVITTASGEEALTIIHNKSVDIGIVDMRLPGIDGNMLILKAHQIIPTMKFLIHTGSVNYKLPISFVKLGITKDHVFIKPVEDMSIISEAISNLIISSED